MLGTEMETILGRCGLGVLEVPQQFKKITFPPIGEIDGQW
jgi:hypothetical protein